MDNVREERPTVLKDELFKYLPYWPWFVVAALCGVVLGYVYMRYAPIVYESVAKIQIVDDTKEVDIAASPLSLMGMGSRINMDNDVEKIRSYRILSQVVEALDLDISYYKKGNIKTTEIWNPPFAITKLTAEDSIRRTRVFDIELNADEAYVTNEAKETVTVVFSSQDTLATGLPFNIQILENANPKTYTDIQFRVVLNPIKTAVFKLAEGIEVKPAAKTGHILSLTLRGESVARSETILNELLNKFNQDGVADRQLVSKRTLDFIDERFGFLASELDSIEGDKESFKRANSLSYIESDAGASLQRKMETGDEAAKLETQLSVSDLLKYGVMDQSEYGLLPVDIGLENSGINSMVSEYNRMAIEREKLLVSVGESHPSLVTLSEQMERSKVNILKTINVYQTQLKLSLRQLNREKSLAGQSYARLPEKEKMLRSIERQQSIKENLFLLLLQKREEAAISYAVTAPSVKIVDYAVTNDRPIAPKKKIVYALGFLTGLFVPFAVLFTKFSLDSKIRDRADLEKADPDTPILAEIPFFKGNKNFADANDRSILAEAFRILSTNLGYLLPKQAQGSAKVIFVTSSIEGEGKSLMAYNLSLSLASLNKKVLLVGADLRKPQLNDYFNVDDEVIGLSDYLYVPDMDWRDCVHQGNEGNMFHKVCFSGSIPINAPQLLAGEGFPRFLEQAKSEFEYIVVDTAPTMLVADTLLISKYADVTVYVTRAGHTDKKVLDFSRELGQTNKLKNMAYVVNDVVASKNKAYVYGGYGYEDKGRGKKRK